ncbi:uncharacterized protein LOC121400511 isoform X2 [Xenopus laevis]|uniref:Uncharacterized protein LOC121400511 isoform X2 n=1 Tax=Xenopus laevis TaxID=8355 RepID=A0A8J1MD69_XENLA|nr:uncharacterized protein LOC121400511 isoform X2 [Xenopus laevis]
MSGNGNTQSSYGNEARLEASLSGNVPLLEGSTYSLTEAELSLIEDVVSRVPGSLSDVLYELLRHIKTHRKALMNHPFVSKSLIKMDYLQLHNCAKRATNFISQTSESPAFSVEKTYTQEGPLNLSHRLQRLPDSEKITDYSAAHVKKPRTGN